MSIKVGKLRGQCWRIGSSFRNINQHEWNHRLSISYGHKHLRLAKFPINLKWSFSHILSEVDYRKMTFLITILVISVSLWHPSLVQLLGCRPFPFISEFFFPSKLLLTSRYSVTKKTHLSKSHCAFRTNLLSIYISIQKNPLNCSISLNNYRDFRKKTRLFHSKMSRFNSSHYAFQQTQRRG